MKQRGVTLIELILYIALIGVILGMISVIFFGMFSNYTRDRQAQYIESEGAAALTRIRQAVRNAESVNNIDPGENDTRLELSVPDASETPIVIERDATTLTISKGEDTATALTSSAVEAISLTFNNQAASDEHDTIQIRFTLRAPERADTTGQLYEQEFVGSAHLRSNYD